MLTVSSSQQVPVLVRFFDDVPAGHRVLGRPGAGDAGKGYAYDRLECHLVLAPGEETVVRYELDGDATAAKTDGDAANADAANTDAANTDAANTDAVNADAADTDGGTPDATGGAADGDPATGTGSEKSGDADRTAGGDGTVEVAAVVPLPSGRTDDLDAGAFWWAGDDVHVNGPLEPDGETVSRVDPDDDHRLIGDGGSLDLDPGQTGPASSTPLPALGIVATADAHESVVRSVVRARSRGHAVYVTYADQAGEETARLGGELGAVVVEPPAFGMDRPDLRAVLVDRARADDQVGLVVQPVGSPPVDYERTTAAFEPAAFESTAIPETWAAETAHPHVVVAIPAYNAAGTVGDVVRAAADYADLVLVVDDGSADGTGDVAREAGAFVVEHRRNRGYGGALKTAFREADRLEADHLVVIDADGQHDPADVPRLVEAQKETDSEIVIGSRYAPESRTELPLVRKLGLTVVNVLTNLSLGHVRPREFVHDTQSGFRAYDRDAIASLAADPDLGDRMGASTDIIYHAHRERFHIHEVGTTISYDVDHSSTLNPLSHGYDLVRNIFYTVTVVHPFESLGVLGAVLTSLGIGVVLEGVSLGLEQGNVPFVKTYAATLVALLGIVLVLLAVDYHTLKSHPYYRRGNR